MAKRRTKAKLAKGPALVARRLGLSPPGPYHVLVLGEPGYAADGRVLVAAGSAAHVSKVVRQTRYWGINLDTIARGNISRQELEWIQRAARAAKLDGPWCRISRAIGLVLDAYVLSDSPDVARMEEAKRKVLKFAAV